MNITNAPQPSGLNLHRFANPGRFLRLSGAILPWLVAAALITTAAGLVWGLLLGPAGYGVKLFFLGCILVAGLYGGITATRKILFIQAIPAAIGIALVLAAAHG